MKPALPPLFGRPVVHVHCVGVGGMGVGPLAIYLAGLGFAVTGEDDALTDEMREQLARAGVAISGITPACELVVYSSAIASTHPAYVAAVARNLRLVRRGEMLAEVTRHRKLVAVCGSHGKTTTTAMLITALGRAQFPAGYVLGGLFANRAAPAAAGSNDWVIAEIDESDGTIGAFSPEITVAVNLDWDHPDHYRRMADIEAAFAALFQRTRSAVLTSDSCAMSARVVALCGAPSDVAEAGPGSDVAGLAEAGPGSDVAGLAEAGPGSDVAGLAEAGPGSATPATPSTPGSATPATPSKSRSTTPATAAGAATQKANTAGPRYLTFGTSGDFQGTLATTEAESMTLTLGGRFTTDTAVVRAHGAFNAANATAALAAAQLMGAPIGTESLAAYPAVRRRQSILPAGGLTVIEDYAHHPAEIRALLGSLRARLTGKGRLVVIFQPHRFSRTAQFKTDFAAALALADHVHLLDVYSAGEPPVSGGTTADLLTELRRGHAGLPTFYTPTDDEAFYSALSLDVREGDLVAFVGAGDIDKKAREWLGRRTTRVTIDWDQFVEDVKPKLASASKLKREEPLATKTTMRVGGAARVYADPASLEDLQCVLREARVRSIPVFVLGRGSNLLVPDEGVDGLVISLTNEVWATFEPRPDGRVWAGAGLRLKNLCGLAAKAGLRGFEFLEGIPASLGGALRMNAGAMGGWTFDVVEEVQLITRAGEVKTMPKSALHVDYRHCAELEEAIALGALLRPAAQGNAAEVRQQMDAYAKKRHESQPREPSAGCIFKNPPGTSAGRLIDQCGLKGERVGDAEVSPVHANFIVNRGHATSADVLTLVRRVRARVRESTGIDLQPEVMLYGKRWEDVL